VQDARDGERPAVGDGAERRGAAQDVDQADREEERDVLEVVALDSQGVRDGGDLLVPARAPAPKTAASSALM
jgi:hypothetical protein